MMNIPYKPTNPIKYKGIEVGIWMGIVIAILYFLINYLYINSGSTFSTLQPIQSFFNRTLPTNSQAIVYLESIGNKSRAEIVANIYGFTWTSFIITLFALIISHAIFYKYFLKANKAAFSGIAPDAVDGPRFISTIFFGAAVVLRWPGSSMLS